MFSLGVDKSMGKALNNLRNASAQPEKQDHFLACYNVVTIHILPAKFESAFSRVLFERTTNQGT